MGDVPHLVKMQSEFADRGVKVLGVTRFPAADAQLFVVEQGINYPVIADGASLFEAYGVKAVWGSVVYLIDADEKIVARGIEDVRKRLGSVPTSG